MAMSGLLKKNTVMQSALPENDPESEFMILADLIDFGQD